MMQHAVTSADPLCYERTLFRFENKRSLLPQEALHHLALEAIRRIETAQHPFGSDHVREIAQNDLLDFVHLLQQPDKPEGPLMFINRQLSVGMSLQQVYLGYIAPAAALLGQKWESGDITPLVVTIGTGQLYAVMRAIRHERQLGSCVADVTRFAMFATVPGETHGIGITMAADLFREAGWDIDLRIGSDKNSLIEHVAKTRPPIIGLSLSTDDRLLDLVDLVIAMRITNPAMTIGVAVSEGLDAETIDSVVDVDLLFHDIRSAITDLEDCLKQRWA